MKKRSLKRSLSMALVLAITASMASPAVIQAADTMPWTGDKAIGKNQPHMVGQRIYDLKYWETDSEDYAELMTAKVPLQERNEAFAATQANPEITSKAEIFNMQGDYGNSFFEGTPYNNAFAPYAFNYWQYTDYYASWHGVTTKGVPENLYDPEGYWGDRAFEFGLVNMPNPAYTNAAHKNGAKSIGCIFLPRTGQTHHSMLEKDENGEFPVAKKLIAFANYYGFDGYFINQEETIPQEDVPVYKEFTKYLIDNGMYIQWYDSITPSGSLSYQNQLNASNSTFIHDDAYGLGKVNSSLFVNYDWFYSSRVETSLQHAADRGINPFTEVFFGVEANQGKLSGSHGSAREVPQIYEPGTKNLRASIALFTPSDWIQRGLEDDIGVKGAENDSGYYWMIAERERMYYSGVAQDPTNTGKMSGYENSDIGVKNASGWVGVADFTSERSVINGTTFYTNFNTGHGMEYYDNGQVMNENEWANVNIQDILPTWQWWIDTEGTKLNVDYDYGEKYQRLDKSGADIGTEYQKVGAYKGGSSLVVSGDLDAENFLHLYKTDLSVNDNTKVSITYNKASADDASKMEVGVIFKNDPDTVVTFNVPQANKQTDGWVTKQISLGDYAGEEIAAIGLNFDNGSATVEDYQMNIGELKVTDGSVAKPEEPTGFHVANAYDGTGEMIVKWDLADYSDVQQYNLYANLSDGSRVYLGGTYDNIYYIKSLYGEKDIVTLELKAVNEEGVESAAATTTFQYSDKVSNIVVDEAETENGNKVQAANVGYLDVSWENPSVDYEGIEITVTPAKYYSYEARDLSFTTTVGKDVNSARVETRIGDGSKYTLSMRLIYADGTKGEPVEYTGYFKDVTSEPFEASVTMNGQSVTFNVPKSEDWWHMYAYVDGQPLFDPYAIRGKTKLDNIFVPTESGVIEVILEDYSGNMSQPVLIPYGQDQTGAPDETMFPDPILLEAVRTQIGTTREDINNFDGTLDLSNLDIQDYTGLEYIKADTIDLTGSNLTAIQQGTFNSDVKHVILKDSTSLAYIYFDAFKGGSVKSIDISGCSALQVIGLNDSELETIEYGDFSAFSNVVSVNLSGSCFDLSEGTPEKAFVDAMIGLTAGKEDIETVDPRLSSLSKGATIVSSNNISSVDGLFDGNETGGTIAMTLRLPGEVVIDLGSEQTVESYNLVGYMSGLGPKSFNISYSDNLQNWITIDEVTGNTSAKVDHEIVPAITARYFKLEVTQANLLNMCYMLEWSLMGHENLTYLAGVQYENQSPNAYLVAPEEVVRVEQEKGLILNIKENLNSFATIRGTDFASLKDADFIDPAYDLDAAASNTDLHEVRIEDANGNVTFDTIDASTAGSYTVEYITYNDASPTGRVMYTQTVYVRGITTVLEKIIANAEKLMENGALDNTMEAVVEEFNAALAHAKEIVAKDGATQQEINDATERLLKVMGKVDWKQGDKTVLEVAVDIANAIKPDLDLYVEAGKQEFLDALAVAESLLESGNAWQEEIDKAADDLMEAMSNLRMKPNKDILNDMINKAEGTDLSGYTEDSVAALNAALANAQTVAADENASQDEVDAAADSLKAAMSGLVFVDNEDNSSAEDTEDNAAGKAETSPVGDGTTPTKTGDVGVASVAALALLSTGALVLLKKRNSK